MEDEEGTPNGTTVTATIKHKKLRQVKYFCFLKTGVYQLM